MTFRENKWTQHTVSPKKKKKTDNCLQSFCWWSCTKTGKVTPYLFLDWRISTTNERNIPHLRKKTVVSIPLSKTAQGMKLWTKSHQLCASTSKMNFLVTCGVSANWITLSPLSLKAAKFLWICLCLACTEILLTTKKKNKINNCAFKRLKLPFSSMLLKWMIQSRPWADVFLFFPQSLADLCHGQGM